MKKVLFLAVVVLIATSLSASAAYQRNWVQNFETYGTGAIAPLPVHTPGEDGWQLADNPSYTDEVPMDVVVGAGRDGSVGIKQRGDIGNLHNAAIKPMQAPNKPYYAGYAKFWVYDPGFALNKTEARVGVYGDLGENNIGKMVSAQIQDASTRDPNYWYAQWSYSVGKLDGTTAIAPAAGYTFTQGAAAPRVWDAWSYVMITWSFAYTIPNDVNSGGSGVIKWYVNRTTQPSLTLNVTSASTRWNNFKDVSGLFVGSGMTTVHSYPVDGRLPAYDDIEFHANAVPEPSSLLALGTGMVGLLGLIRRRR